jgi:hypothetical protein
MALRPKREEIDHRTIKLIVGVIAISLPFLTSAFAGSAIASISASYYEGGWSQSIFVGFLFAISAFLLAYNGLTPAEMILSKVAAIAALGVALFPCGCGSHAAMVPYVHGASAAVMFVILAFFCRMFFKRALQKGYPEAKARASIYVACGTAIVLAILALAVDHFSGGALSRWTADFVFYGESVGLIAFGISWLTASRTIPMLAREDERFSPLREDNPG